MVALFHPAKIDKGKKFDKVREPIMIYVFVSLTELQDVETYLAHQRYFDYTGILVFPTDVMPNLDQNGRIVFRDKESISFSSIGSGGFFHCLKRDGLLSHMKSQGIEFVQVLNVEHVNASIMPAALLGYMTEDISKPNMIAEVSQTDSGYIQYPTIVQNAKTNELIYSTTFAQKQMRDSSEHAFKPRYQLHSTNCMLTVEFIERALTNHKSDLFQYNFRLT